MELVIAMEIDSGAAISAISEEFCRKKFSGCKLKLVGYLGEHLKVHGCIEPELSFNGFKKCVKFAVHY